MLARAGRPGGGFPVPVLRIRTIDNMIGSIDVLASAVATRTGRSTDDTRVRAFASAAAGAMLAG